MKDENETKKQLINELDDLRQRITNLERSETERMRMELFLGLSDIFEALKKISSGDPTVRIDETSEVELISRLKHMINLTAENIGEIVDQSHEFAIGLAEHFDVLHRVSRGDLNARVSGVGVSQIELLESLKEATNQMIESISREIAERKLVEESLIESEERYKQLVSAVTTYTYSVEVSEGRAISTRHSTGCIPVTGYYPEDYESNPHLWYSMIYPDDRIKVENSIAEILAGHKVPPIEHRIIRRDGTVVWVRDTTVPYYDGKGLLIRYDGLIEDVTERKLVEEELRRVATLDKLTGAYNRTKFEEIIEREIERVKRYDQPLSMIMFDIDHFKKVNDKYGHSAGDYVLKTIADIVRENIRKIDYFVRWGGEEFMIISSETNLDKARVLAERIRKVIENYNFDNVGKVTVSFGVTEFKERDTEDSFINKADDAMYNAKKKGRNRVEVIV